MRESLADRLAERLRRPLPGLHSQRRMAPTGRISPDYDPDPPGAYHAAVLAVITSSHELVYIRRAEEAGPHSRQIAFPGGARERGDADLEATALRETYEEIGVSSDSLVVLGALTPIYIGVSNFTVHPFIAYAPGPLVFRCQRSEVEEAIPLPITRLAEAAATRQLERRGALDSVPCYAFDSLVIWGATAMITAELLDVLHDVES
ncbi:MAG: NUDIX hydrolase [Spirochaetota bacterium]